MKINNYLRYLFAVGFVFLLVFFVLPIFGKSLTQKTNETCYYLYTQTSSHAVLANHPNKAGWYQLTLHDVQPNILYFSDRPYRVVGFISNELFIKSWDQGTDSFGRTHPNASMIFTIKGDKNQRIFQDLVVLKTPVYHEKNRTMTYEVKKLDHMHLKTGDLIGVSLFID